MTTKTQGKHTPGPWVVAEHQKDTPGTENWPSLIVQAGGHNICEIDLPDETDEANAHLIAAAPALLEACSGALNLLQQIPVPGSWAVMAEARIELLEAAIRAAKEGV